MSEIRSHRDLVAWQKAVELGLELYALTRDFPDAERFGLVSQLRRAGVSVASNIAEGYGRGTTADYIRFLRAARGSLYEIDTQVLFAARLGYLKETDRDSLTERVNECGRILAALIRSLEAKQSH
jgi:four helix bundle protein